MYDAELVKLLKNGGTVVMPCDTIYGICASALNKNSVERVYNIKSRNLNKPCIVLVSSADGIIDNFLLEKSMLIKAKNYWPGPVSIVIDYNSSQFDYLHRGSGSIAFRVPGVKALRELLKQTGPLIAPSANPENSPPATTIQEAYQYFGDKVDYYLDGGTMAGKPSRIIHIAQGNKPKILRD